MESRERSPAYYRVRELIVHAREGSPIALAAVVGFVDRKLPQISPQLILSFAEQILENCENDAPAAETTDEHRLQPWPRGDQIECSAANPSKLDASMKTRKRNGHRASTDFPCKSPGSLRRASG